MSNDIVSEAIPPKTILTCLRLLHFDKTIIINVSKDSVI